MNLKTEKKTPLVPSTLEINGKKNLITNSLVVSQDSKVIYFTVSSTNFQLTNGMYEILTVPSGRVLKYDVYGNISKVNKFNQSCSISESDVSWKRLKMANH